jgi:hypothetical protein
LLATALPVKAVILDASQHDTIVVHFSGVPSVGSTSSLHFTFQFGLDDPYWRAPDQFHPPDDQLFFHVSSPFMGSGNVLPPAPYGVPQQGFGIFVLEQAFNGPNLDLTILATAGSFDLTGVTLDKVAGQSINIAGTSPDFATVPGPIVGAGLPGLMGLMLASGRLLAGGDGGRRPPEHLCIASYAVCGRGQAPGS